MNFLSTTNEPDFHNPLFWAIMIGWIFTVVLHEFAHGLVGYLGGDYTIRQRGGLTLNPFQYIHPVFSILLPVVFLAMGGIPLPGGATYIRHDLLRNKYWDSAVSLAGPLTNVLIFLGLCLVLSPRVGWIDQNLPVAQWTNVQKFVGAMAMLQILAAVFNLVPIPPLDGFGIIRPFLPRDVRMRLSQPQVVNALFFGFVFVVWMVPGVGARMYEPCFYAIRGLGLHPIKLYRAFYLCLWGG